MKVVVWIDQQKTAYKKHLPSANRLSLALWLMHLHTQSLYIQQISPEWKVLFTPDSTEAELSDPCIEQYRPTSYRNLSRSRNIQGNKVKSPVLQIRILGLIINQLRLPSYSFIITFPHLKQ